MSVDSSADPSLWLLDGFNVLHVGILRGRERGTWWREGSRARLLSRVERFEERDAEIWVVFDGPGPDPETSPSSRLRVVFAASADEWLLRRIRHAESPARVAVVTADRRLAARSRHRGAQVVSPAAFLARCPEA